MSNNTLNTLSDRSNGTLKTLPPSPDELNPEAKKTYEQLGKILIDNNLFFKGDLKVFCRLCHLYSVVDRLEKEMNDAWSEKFVKQNFHTYDKLLKSLLSLETAFCLNPASRTRGKINVNAKQKKAFNTGGRVE